MIKIVIDSTCDLEKKYLKKYDVAVLPLSVILDDKAFLDGVDITTDEVFTAMKKDIVPKTSQVRPGDAHALFEKYAKNGDDFIYLCFSKEMSGTYAMVSNIIGELQAQYPQRKMAIVDTQSGSVAVSIIALQLLSMIEEKKSFAEVLQLAEEMSGHVEHRFLINDLSWLAKSGRINKAVAITGRIIGVKPVLYVNEGKIKMLRIIRGSTRYLQHLATMIVETCKEFPHQVIGISYSDDKQIALDLAKMVTEMLGDCRVMVTRIGSVLASHLGMGGVGAFFMKNKPSYYNFDFAKDI